MLYPGVSHARGYSGGTVSVASILQVKGKWRALVRRKGHSPICKTHRTKAEAERWARGIETQLDAGVPVQAEGVSVGDLIATYRKLRDGSRPIRDDSNEHYMLKCLGRLLGSADARQLSVDDLVAFAQQRKDEGAGPYTINMDLSKLGTVLRFTSAARRLALPDAVGAARPLLAHLGLIGGGGRRERRPTEDELTRIEAHLRQERGNVYADAVLFSVATAMRRGEVCALAWADIDRERRLALIRNRKDPRKKVGNDQWVPLLPAAWTILTRQPEGIVGDGGISRVLSAMRARAGAALMFANVSNTLQQVSGFATAFSKLKSDGMRSDLLRSTARFLRNPKKMAEAVAAASPYMAQRMQNEVAAMQDAMNEILLDPNLYERAQAWTARHAYFMQAALDNTMGPIIWSTGYNAAVKQGLSDEQAVQYADGLIRQTQGSTLPEDVSRIETGPAYARVFTQFIGYFNMMANTNATALKQISDEVGLKRGAGKALMIVTLGVLVPLWVAEAIAQGMRGGPEDEDGDGYLDDWLAAVLGMGTIKGLFAAVPFIGQLANAGLNRANNNPADDRVSLSPAVSMLEAAVGAPFSVYDAIVEDGNQRKAVRDVASLVSMATGLPATALARPLGYLAGTEQGTIAPTSAADAARGAISGVPSPESKTR